MLQYNPSISGSLNITGSLIISNGMIGTVNGVDVQIFSSSISQVVTNIQAATGSQEGRLGSIESFTSSTSARLNSIETTSASVDTLNTTQNSRLSALETTSASVDTLNTNQNTRLTGLEIKTGSLATTGSNTFIGTQTITGSLFISSNLIVQGSSSLQNITASAVSIGTNLINLNTANPAIRYAGLVIGDSGSVGGSGSFLYDSVQDEMLFIHRGTSTVVTSSVTLMGPETYDNLGNEIYITTNRLTKGSGNEHLVDSCIFDNGTTVCINATLKASGQVCSLMGNFSCVGIGTITPTALLHVSGTPGQNNPSIRLTDSSVSGNGGNVFISADKTGVGYNNLTTVAFSHTFKGGGSATNYLTIDSDGISCFVSRVCAPTFLASTNIGINETSPLAPIHISKQTNWGTSDNRIININNTGAGGDINQPHNMGSITWYSGNSTPTAEIAAYRNTPASGNNIELRFLTAAGGTPIERMRIASGGNVSIGIPTSSAPLTIRCDASSQSAIMEIATCFQNAYRYVSINAGAGISYCIPGGTSQSSFIEVQGGDASVGGGAFRIRTGAMGSVTDKLNIAQNGVACFASNVCAANFSSPGFLRVHNTMRTFAISKNFGERETDVNYFRISASVGNGYQVMVYSMAQNPSVGWTQSQLFQAATAPYWGGWIGTSSAVSTIGSGAGFISSAVVGNDGTITFRVSTGNNGTNTTGTIVSYIQVTAFSIDTISMTAL